MTRLTWDTVGQRFYEIGVDRGVLYVDTVGYSWNGLVSVEEAPAGGEARSFYIDGVKYLNVPSKEEYEAAISALYSPPQFDACDGAVAIHPGLYATQQRRKSFGLSYRTRVGNDIDSHEYGYKIHIVYNALAMPTQRRHQSVGNNPEAHLLNWSITAKPEVISGAAHSSHLIVDTTIAPAISVEALEDILYGTDVTAPELPTPTELIAIFA